MPRATNIQKEVENLIQKLEDKNSEIKMIVKIEVLQLVNEQRYK